MTEALQAAIGHMFMQLKARRVIGECVASNAASQRVMIRAGLRRAQLPADSKMLGPDGENALQFALESADWQLLAKRQPIALGKK